MYRDEVIHFIGGVHDYLGELDQSEHPMGKHWYRIKKPCLIFRQEDAANKKMTQAVASLAGPQKAYLKYVDIYVPPESIMEIRTLDKNGKLYEIYKQEAERVAPSLIHMPDSSILPGMN